jgi:hypothetical protein
VGAKAVHGEVEWTWRRVALLCDRLRLRRAQGGVVRLRERGRGV